MTVWMTRHAYRGGLGRVRRPRWLDMAIVHLFQEGVIIKVRAPYILRGHEGYHDGSGTIHPEGETT